MTVVARNSGYFRKVTIYKTVVVKEEMRSNTCNRNERSKAPI